MGDRERERLRKLHDRFEQAGLAILLLEDVLLRRGQQAEPFLRPAGPLRPIEAVEQAAAHLVLLGHRPNGLLLVEGGLPLAAALRVDRQRVPQGFDQAQVVHHQAAGLIPEDAVDPRDGLHQPVPAHRLVHIHGVQARRVEAGQPHIAHDHDPERVVRVLEPEGQLLPPGLVADVRLPVERVGRGAGHHDLDRPLAVVVAMPIRPQRDDGVVQVHADAPAHADDHRLAFHRLEPPLEMRHQVGGHQRHAALRAHQRLQLRPAALQLLHLLDLLAFGCLLEVPVHLGAFGLVEQQLRQAVLVVDGHRRAVDHRLPDVVDADVVAEDRPRIGVGARDGRAGEADERGVGQRVARVPGEAVDEVVLAALRLVGDHHDVTPLGQCRGVLLRAPVLLEEELLDGGEDHPARRHAQLRGQVRAALGLDRRLAQQVLIQREVVEELVIQVVAVGQHHDGGVLHQGVLDDLARVERHGQALARALRVPHHANAPVAGMARQPLLRPAHPVQAAHLPHPVRLRRGRARAQRLLNGCVDRVILVVPRHLLDQHAVAGVLEDDEIADQVEEARRIEDPLDHHLELAEVLVVQRRAADRPPRHEALAVRGQAADACVNPVGDDQRLVEGEQGLDLLLVGLELVEGRPDGGLLVRRVLQLHHRQRQAVHEEHHVRAALVAPLHHGELVHRQPVVVSGLIVIQHAHQVAAERAVGPEVLHRHPLHQHAVGRVVVRGQGGPVGPGQLAVGLIQRGRGRLRVELRQRVPQPPRQHGLAVVVALRGRLPRRDLRPEPHRVAQPVQPPQRGLFDLRLVEVGHGFPLRAALLTRYSRSVKPPSRSKAAA